MHRKPIAVAGLLVLGQVGVVAAQDASPAAGVDTYCLTVDVPSGTAIDESTVLADPSILTVVAVDACGGAEAEDAPSGVFPAGSEVSVGQWNINVEDVDNSAWKRIKKENMFNDPPPRGSRLVMLTVRIGHDEQGTSYDPGFAIETSLFGPQDSMEEYDGVEPGTSLFGLDGIPGGRSKTFTETYVVPNDVKLSDLVLYIEGEEEFAEVSLDD